jgi:hypothetical protein
LPPEPKARNKGKQHLLLRYFRQVVLGPHDGPVL